MEALRWRIVVIDYKSLSFDEKNKDCLLGECLIVLSLDKLFNVLLSTNPCIDYLGYCLS